MADDGTANDWWVVCLCAAWCNVCRDWLPQFEALAGTTPTAKFATIDIEDEDEAMGDHEVETFPTVLIAHGRSVHFLGPVTPSAAQVGQLLARLQAEAQPRQAPADAQDLWHRLLPIARAQA